MAEPGDAQISSVLTTVLGDSVLRPGSEEYDKSNGSYFSAFENEIKPAFIAKPSSPEQVQDLIKALRPHLLSGGCQVAIRGTGHTPIASSANVQNGVTVDTRGLKGITLNGDKSIVELGVGETWATAYTELEKHGLTVAGGRVGRIGVGGLILGGGLSMFSKRRGFACDSVTEFKVVLASGDLVRANAEENPDLWYALKGGLNNFGIVTSLKMKTFQSGDIWGGLTYYMPETFPQLIERTCDYAYNETDEDTHIMCSAGYGFGHQAITVVMYHTQGLENPPALQRFTAVEPQIKQMGSMRKSTHLDFCDELSKFTTDGVRQYWASITVKPDPSLLGTFHEKWQKAVEALKDADGFIFTLGMHPLTRTLLENSAKAGGNAKAIPPSDGPLLIILINPIWNAQQDDSRIFAYIRNLVAEFRQLASEKGLLHRYIFTNYADAVDSAIAGYGEESVAKLREASKKYDPEGVFQKGVPGGFKLPSVVA
ncbi:FAD-binding domain-containing protein [Sodiomyces alkalinus F11]|uniref:FAD-binding domain-containing protein n=1 Tax=Sodiomyces alkalinus (strain CBS 110278 / VKM F-3762 / F11) TaxID=1314773 RepID=A0A3N2PTJ3_SODAK|nr:FAD-binding domain-containing protein [Sodiomyces alkalinus F11]ROT37823.1 FAD-binding domain-containing protein [Sodiomyces alkalinus F11]